MTTPHFSTDGYYLSKTRIPEPVMRAILRDAYTVSLTSVPVANPLGSEQGMKWSEPTTLEKAWKELAASTVPRRVALQATPVEDADFFIDLDMDEKLMGPKYAACLGTHNGPSEKSAICPKCWTQFMISVTVFLETFIQNLGSLYTALWDYNNDHSGFDSNPPVLDDFLVSFSGNRGVHIWAHPSLGLRGLTQHQRRQILIRCATEWDRTLLSGSAGPIKAASMVKEMFVRIYGKAHGITEVVDAEKEIKKRLAADARDVNDAHVHLEPGDYIWILKGKSVWPLFFDSDSSSGIGQDGLGATAAAAAASSRSRLGHAQKGAPVPTVPLPVDMNASSNNENQHKLRVPFSANIKTLFVVTPFDFVAAVNQARKMGLFIAPSAFALVWHCPYPASSDRAKVWEAAQDRRCVDAITSAVNWIARVREGWTAHPETSLSASRMFERLKEQAREQAEEDEAAYVEMLNA